MKMSDVCYGCRKRKDIKHFQYFFQQHPYCLDCYCDSRRSCKICRQMGGYWLYTIDPRVCDVCIEVMQTAKPSLEIIQAAQILIGIREKIVIDCDLPACIYECKQ